MPKLVNFDLKVPFSEKDAAKALGAWWSHERKTWFVPHGVALEPFARWLPAGKIEAEAIKAGRRANRPPRKLSMTDAAIRSRAKKAAAHAARPPRRADDVTGKVTIGENYRPVLGAVGLPWDV